MCLLPAGSFQRRASAGVIRRFSVAFSRPLAVVSALIALFFAAVGGQAKIGVAHQMLLGNPSSATTNAANTVNYLIQRDQYALSYNDTTRQANWVSWNFTTEDRGSASRSDDFFQDTTLPDGYYQVKTTDYSGSGYDRGHMCPSADRTASRADNDATFFMSNMVPQAPDNNQGVWANFENETRAIAATGYEMLIISGPSLFPGTSVASGVKIPGYVWKIVLAVPVGEGSALDRITTSTRVIAIKIPNIAGVRSDPWQNYITTIAQIEADTGYNFLSALPEATANVLRVKVDGQVVTGAPVITGQPAVQTAAVGGSATFSVTATGNATLTYQWFKGEDAIAGATGSTLTVSNISSADVGFYSVVVSNSVGTATSNSVELIVTGLPPVIVTPPAAQTGAAGSTAIFTVAVTGTSPFTYQWRKDTVAISGNASATTANLTLTNIQAADTGQYDVVVTNNAGANTVTSTPVALTVNPAAPTISTQPASRSVGPNGATSFTVVASGTAPLSYQWRKGGVAITGNASATTATLALTNIQTADEGTYDVVVSNTLGNATSTAATLTISNTANGVIYYSGGTYTQDFNSLPSTETVDAATYDYAAVGPYRLDDAPVSATGLGGWSIAKPTSGGGTGADVRFFVDYGNSISGGIYSYGSTGSSERALGSIASGSTICRFGVSLVNNTDQTITTVTINFMTEQWRRGNGPVNKLTGAYAIDATDLNTGTFTAALALDITAPVITGSLVALDGNASANRAPATATLSGISWAPGQKLVLRWTDANDANNDDCISMDDFSFSATLIAPTIDTPPANQLVAAGGTATFTVAASGPGTLSYRWRRNGTALADGDGISGSGTATLTLTGVQAGSAGSYDVVVTNAGGPVTSAAASLTIAAGFDAWRLANFNSTDLADPARSGPNAILTADGLTNLVKYALGLTPGTPATSGLPEITSASGEWVYTYQRPADRTDVTYVVQVSTNLSAWSTDGVTHELVSSAGGIETWRARYAQASAANLFFRLQVTR